MLAVGGDNTAAMGNPQLPGDPSVPGGSVGNPPGPPMGNTMGEQADSQAFQAEGLTDPHNSVGAGALIGQLSAASQAASQASLPATAPEDVQASNCTCFILKMHIHKYT